MLLLVLSGPLKALTYLVSVLSVLFFVLVTLVPSTLTRSSANGNEQLIL